MKKGINETIKLKLGNLQFEEVPINKNNIKDIEIQISCKNTLEAPIKENEIIGKIEVKVKDEVITTQDILLKEEIRKKNVINYIEQLLTNFTSYLQSALA